MSMPKCEGDCWIYVGNLPANIRKEDLDDLFQTFGKILELNLKNQIGAGAPFAFIKYEDPSHATLAVTTREGWTFKGRRLRVEFPRKDGDVVGVQDHSRDRYRRSRSDRFDGYVARDPRTRAPFERWRYSVRVSNLPPTASWQDLKDHMKKQLSVGYVEVNDNGNGTGVVELLSLDDMLYAVQKFDDTKIVSHKGESGYIRVKPGAEVGRCRSRSYTPEPRPRRPESRSPSRSRSRSRGRSRTRRPRCSRSKSRRLPRCSRSKSPDISRPRCSRSKSPDISRPRCSRSKSPDSRRRRW